MLLTHVSVNTRVCYVAIFIYVFAPEISLDSKLALIKIIKTV